MATEHPLNIEANTWAYIYEMTRASDILRHNRHSSVEPYEWLGPDAELNTAGENCPCAGCKARFYLYGGKPNAEDA